MRRVKNYKLYSFEEVTLKQFSLRNLCVLLFDKKNVMKALSTVAEILRNFNSFFYPLTNKLNTVLYCTVLLLALHKCKLYAVDIPFSVTFEMLFQLCGSARAKITSTWFHTLQTQCDQFSGLRGVADLRDKNVIILTNTCYSVVIIIIIIVMMMMMITIIRASLTYSWAQRTNKF